MAVAAEPAGGSLVEGGGELGRVELVEPIRRLVLHVAARQHLRIELIFGRGQPKARRRALCRGADGHLVAHQGRVVDHLARCAKLHGTVGVALARGEAVAERHDEEVFHDDVAVEQLAAVRQLHAHRHARRHRIDGIWDARDSELVLAVELLALDLGALVSCLARLPAPDAVAGHVGELLGRNADVDRVRFRQHVVFLGAAPGIFALANR